MTQDTADSDRVQAITQEIDGELVAQAEDAGVDIDAIVSGHIEADGDFQNSTIARFATAELRQQIEAQNAEDHRGVIMGSRDRHGRNWPRRHSLITSDGDHLEVSSWDGSLPTPGGQEVQIPAGGAAVTMQCEYDSDYESYEAKGIQDIQDIPRDDLLDALGSVAIGPSDLSATDEYEVVVVRGQVYQVEPQTVFVDGEPDHDGDVMLPDERGELRPHVEIRLDQDDGSFVRGHFERQAYGKPYIGLPDFDALCQRAKGQFDDPQDQANFVSNGLEGAEVFMVGNVSSYNQDRNGDGDPVTYVDIGLTALVDAEREADEASAEADSEADESDDEMPPDPQQAGVVSDVRSTIQQYADLTGTDMDDLTVADVQENVDLDASEEEIRAALSGGDAGGSDDEFAALKDGDSYNCPECELVQAGSIAELAGHVADEHKPDESPKAWLRDRA